MGRRLEFDPMELAPELQRPSEPSSSKFDERHSCSLVFEAECLAIWGTTFTLSIAGENAGAGTLNSQMKLVTTDVTVVDLTQGTGFWNKA